MSLSKVKIRLEPEGIRAYHEHALAILHERKRQTSAFLKSMFISKIFFNAARYYEIYKFGMSCGYGLEMFFERANESNLYYSRSFELSPMRLEKLAKFLNPKFFAIRLLIVVDEKIEQCERVLEKLQGKISVETNRVITTRILSFMQKFSTRIHQLTCLTSTLTPMEAIIPTLNLDSCVVWGRDQFSVNDLRLLLLIKAKKLELYTGVSLLEDAILTNVGTTDRNHSVSNLSLKIYDSKYASADLLTDWISTRFPKVQKLDLRLFFGISTEEVNSDDIVKHVLRYYEKLQEVQHIFSHLAHFNLIFRLRGHSFEQLDDSWRAKLGEEFEDSKASISRGGCIKKFIWSTQSNINNCYGSLEVLIWNYTEQD